MSYRDEEMGEFMKIIGYVASPRKDGNTAYVIEQIIEKSKSKNLETEIYYASNFDISPCKGCLWCVDKDKCAIEDDMQKIYTSLKDTDVLVIGTPIYMGQMTGQAKVFMDRLYPQATPRFSPYYNPENVGKKLILVFTQGNPDTSKFQTYIDYTKSIFEMLEFDVVDVLVIGGTRENPACKQEKITEEIDNLFEKIC